MFSKCWTRVRSLIGEQRETNMYTKPVIVSVEKIEAKAVGKGSYMGSMQEL